jgi:putative ATPase
MIFWGPPGVGKTTLANIISTTLTRPFFTLSAINSGVKDIRETIAKAEKQLFFDRPNPILFIDEIHRFSKSQQDSLLGAVEKGIITLIGATTENPSFEVISALLSRCQVYILEQLTKEHLEKAIGRAIEKDDILSKKKISLVETDALLRYSGGDVRKLLNGLELVFTQQQESDEVIVNDELVKNAIQANMAIYDKSGEMHYDIISAFIKSIRGSDPNAAVYYLARMIEGGEDPKFICRRMIISAAEDIGLANPNALLLATSCFDAVTKIGLPEGRIPMSETAIYLATSPKSNSAYLAIKAAQSEVRQSGNLSIPLHLRNAPTKLMQSLDYGKDYKYAHDHKGAFVNLEYLPEELSGNAFYQPKQEGGEKKISEQLKSLWKEKYGY